MKEDRPFDPNPKTPLDDWDDTKDPAQMAGDHWVQEENAPLEEDGFVNSEECEVVEQNMELPGSIFMHPTMNVAYDNKSFSKTRSKNAKKKE